MLPRTLVVLVSLAVLVGCGDKAPLDQPTPLSQMAPTSTVAPPFDPDLEPAEAALAMVPSTATTLRVTDFDQVRAQLGVPDLSSEDPVSERWDFWDRAGRDAVLLTDGMLRADNSELMLDYGFTQDDVDWEAHFTGPGGSGFVIRFRPDLPLAGVTRAVEAGVGPLAGARVIAGDHLVVSGTAEDGEPVWANEPVWDPLVGEPAGATYVRRGCIPVDDALGPSADAERLAAIDEAHPVHVLDDLPAFSVGFGDHLATVRTEPNREDLFTRIDIGRDWPVPGFAATFEDPVADPTTGRIGYHLRKPAAAASLALLDELPFAICAELPSLDEPSGA